MSHGKELSDSLLQACAASTRAANALPTAQSGDFQFFETSFPLFQKARKPVADQLLQQLKRLVTYTAGAPRRFADDESRMDTLVECMDMLLENVAASVDQATGVQKVQLPVGPASSAAGNVVVTKVNVAGVEQSANSKKSQQFSLLQARNIPRPQLRFLDTIDNSRDTPFVPKIRVKPNAIEPLSEVILVADRPQHLIAGNVVAGNGNVPAAIKSHLQSSLGMEAGHLTIEYPHPYGPELRAFVAPESQFGPVKEQLHGSLADTKFDYVDEEAAFLECIRELEAATEIAVDLENHNYRTFQGFVCLMQISTRNHDWLIDTLALRSHMQLLQPVFTNPAIVKVLHGSDSDIIWLQRDFGLYIVNLFDTGQAARVLNLPSFALAYLLHHFCGVTADKKYQLADWRIRPLTAEMSRYAREDTHYLLYIYDRLRNELCNQSQNNYNLTREVWRRSTDLCAKQYEKEPFSWEQCERYINTGAVRYDRGQILTYRALWDWRDNLARMEDESVHYVLPRHMLARIAETMPRDSVKVLACCNPIPPLVRANVHKIVELINDARRAAAAASTEVLNPTPVTPVSPPVSKPQPTSSSTTPAQAPPVSVIQAPVKVSHQYGVLEAVVKAKPVLAAPSKKLGRMFCDSDSEMEPSTSDTTTSRKKALAVRQAIPAQTFHALPESDYTLAHVVSPIVKASAAPTTVVSASSVTTTAAVMIPVSNQSNGSNDHKRQASSVEEKPEEEADTDDAEAEADKSTGTSASKKRKRHMRHSTQPSKFGKVKAVTEPVQTYDYAAASRTLFSAGKPTKVVAAFDPKAVTEEPKMQKEPRINVKSKTGIRSASFK